MNPTIKQNLSNSTTWFRLLFMLFFVLVYWITLWVAALLMLFQFVTTLITGQANANLHGFNRSVARYVEQIMQYLLFCSEKRPFPFSAWPPVESAPRTAGSETEQAAGADRAMDQGESEPATDPGSRE